MEFSLFPITNPVGIFLVVLAIILLTPTLFTRLKIPYVIGMIICGVAVGPYGFNLLSRDASFEIFGQVGILYLMFLAAVEIDMYHLRQNLRKGVLYGLLTFAIPTVAGLLLCRYALGTPWTTAVLVASMFASHTLITYPMVSRFGINGDRSVIITVCSTIVAVFLALILLAEVHDITVEGLFKWGNIPWLLLKVAIYSAVIALAYPPMVRWFFRTFSDTIYWFIFILALVLLASVLAQGIGIEGILGAFYAGLVLNRFIPNHSRLMSKILFAGNAIFIPYFLIGVGMLINVKVIFMGWRVVYIALLMTVTALTSKWLAAFIFQKITGMNGTQRRLMFGLSAGKAAATLAATMVGYSLGLLSEDMMNGAIIMILGCCAVASLATDPAAKRMRIHITDDDLNRGPDKERLNARQVVAIANPLTAESITNIAIYMRHPENRSPLNLIFVRNNDDKRIMAMGRQALETASQIILERELECRKIERYDLNIGTGLVNVSKEQDATDIYVGLHRRSNIVDTFYGSLIEQLLSQSNRMVVINRCFIPVNTARRIVVVVPDKAEYETGFRIWVERMGNMALQLGAPIRFIAYPSTIPYIQGVLDADGYDIDHLYSEMHSYDDFILLSNEIQEDDIMVVIAARRGSISFGSEMEQIPSYLSRYFSRHNLVVVYPEQFGDTAEMPTPIDPLAQQPAVTTTPWAIFFSRLWPSKK